MIRLVLWLLAAGDTPKRSGPLRIPIPFEDAVRAALEIPTKARRQAQSKDREGKGRSRPAKPARPPES